jgi:hypothetical protein
VWMLEVGHHLGDCTAIDTASKKGPYVGDWRRNGIRGWGRAERRAVALCSPTTDPLPRDEIAARRPQFALHS